MNGTVWAASLWDLRTHLKATEPDGLCRTDLLVLKALLELGQIARPRSDAALRYLCRARASFEVGLAALLRADELLNAGRYREAIFKCFSKCGIHRAPNFVAGENGNLRLV